MTDTDSGQVVSQENLDVKDTTEADDNKATDGQEVADESHVPEETIEKLSFGLLEKCLPSLQKSKSSLDDVLQNQTILIETVQQENNKFNECKSMEDLIETMNQAKKYCNKLIYIKKEMAVLSEKSFRLKKRALKLQQQKQKEDLQRVHQLEREQEREKMLEARVAKKSSTPM